MAPKRAKPLEDPPPASSSEEDEETDSGEEEGEEGSSSEEEETELTPKPPQIQTSKPAGKKPDSNPQQSDSESDSESDSDSEDDGKATVKPIASKPMEETPSKTTKSRSKLPSIVSASATKSTAAVKRGGETDRDPKDSKRSKKESESDGAVEKSEDTKKQLFQRLWSEADEIAVLEGFIEYAEKKGDPAKDMYSFYEFIKKSLHFDVSISQLRDKISRLKKKFENHVSKGKKGEEKTFSKPHDQKSFDLSKRIWGSGAGGEPNIKSNGKAVSNNNTNSKGKRLAALKAELGVGVDHAEKEAEKVDNKETQSVTKQISEFDKGVSVSGMEDYVLRKGMDMLDGAKKVEMEEKWRKLHVAELELFLKRNELIREQAKLMLAAFKSDSQNSNAHMLDQNQLPLGVPVISTEIL